MRRRVAMGRRHVAHLPSDLFSSALFILISVFPKQIPGMCIDFYRNADHEHYNILFNKNWIVSSSFRSDTVKLLVRLRGLCTTTDPNVKTADLVLRSRPLQIQGRTTTKLN